MRIATATDDRQWRCRHELGPHFFKSTCPGRVLRPFRVGQFESPGAVQEKIGFSAPIPPKGKLPRSGTGGEQSMHFGKNHRLPKGPDERRMVEILEVGHAHEKSTEPRVLKVKLRRFHERARLIREPRFKQSNDTGSFNDREPQSRRRWANPDISRHIGSIE